VPFFKTVRSENDKVMRLSLKKAFIFSNCILLIVFIFFIVTGSIFYFHGKYVTALGDRWIKGYTNSASNKAENAIGSLATGQSGVAESQLLSWRQFQPGDRVYPFKRQIFIEFIRYLHAQKNYAELVDHAGPWLSMNERDVTVRAYWGDAIRQLEGREAEGKQVLVKLWSRFPRNSMVQRFYTKISVEDDDLTALRAIQNRFETDWEEPRHTNGWHLYWDTGRGFNQSESGPARVEKHKGEWQLLGDVPPRAIRVRIDPPSYSILRFSRFSISLGDTPQNSVFGRLGQVHMIQRDGSWLQTTGGDDPYLIFNANDLRVKKIKKDLLPRPKENTRETRQEIAREIGYTGGFGQGGFTQWLKEAPERLRKWQAQFAMFQEDTVPFIGRFQAVRPRHEWFETMTARFNL
jgi:hypothetical protein